MPLFQKRNNQALCTITRRACIGREGFAKKTKISITINQKTLQEIDSLIDHIYIKNRSQAIEYLAKNALGERRTAVIMMGGLEKNLEIGPGLYRPLAKVGKKSVIEHALEKLKTSGFTAVYLIARQKVLTSLFDVLKNGEEYGVKIQYVEEKNSDGTAESLKSIKGKITTQFLVIYGDILFEKMNIDELWNDHIKHHALATIMLTTSARPNEKGTVRVEGTKVLEFTQKPKKSDIYLVFSPLFVADTDLLEYPGKSLEFNVFPELVKKGLLNGHLSSEKERHIHSIIDIRK